MQEPSKYSKNQVILNSGRLLFNAKSDSILLFANESIGFSSNKSVNIDTDGHFITNASKIFLGLNSINETEPMLLGNTTREVLASLVKCLDQLATGLISDPNVTTAKQGAGFVKGVISGNLNNYKLTAADSTVLSKKTFTE